MLNVVLDKKSFIFWLQHYIYLFSVFCVFVIIPFILIIAQQKYVLWSAATLVFQHLMLIFYVSRLKDHSDSRMKTGGLKIIYSAIVLKRISILSFGNDLLEFTNKFCNLIAKSYFYGTMFIYKGSCLVLKWGILNREGRGLNQNIILNFTFLIQAWISVKLVVNTFQYLNKIKFTSEIWSGICVNIFCRYTFRV